ncbi:MAG: iron-containing alcohol dehydrogenase, partial [Actinomycetes bacterium]
MTATRIGVGGAEPYEVVVGGGVLGELPSLLGDKVRTVGLVHPVTLPEIAGRVEAALRDAGYRVVPLPVPDGEQAKSVQVAAELWSALGRNGVTRSDAVVGVGGGATTDLAGFVAATWL